MPSTATNARTYDDVIAAVRAQQGFIASHGDENDRTGRIAAPAVDVLFDTGAIGIFSPRETVDNFQRFCAGNLSE
jgi:hypothetical protein